MSKVNQDRPEMVKNFTQTGFTVRAVVNDFHVAFEGYQIVAFDAKSGEIFYAEEISPRGTDINEVEPFFTGFVKWDGCSNWNVGNEGEMIHACGRDILSNVVSTMGFCWDWAASLLPNFIGK